MVVFRESLSMKKCLPTSARDLFEVSRLSITQTKHAPRLTTRHWLKCFFGVYTKFNSVCNTCQKKFEKLFTGKIRCLMRHNSQSATTWFCDVTGNSIFQSAIDLHVLLPKVPLTSLWRVVAMAISRNVRYKGTI